MKREQMKVRVITEDVMKDHHCTMGQAMEIGSSKIFRSKGLVFAQFWSKSENSSSDWWTTDQILKEKYSRHIFAKKGVSLDKNLKGVSDHLEIWHAKRFCGALKKPDNNVLVPGPVHCENGFNVWKLKYSSFFPIFTKGI